MIRDTDALKTLRNSAFVHNHSSSPSWPALAQGFRRAKKPGCWPRGSTDEARSSPGSDSGNATGPGTHWHARFWPDSGNTAMELQTGSEIKSMITLMSLILKNVTNPIFHYMTTSPLYNLQFLQICHVYFHCLFII